VPRFWPFGWCGADDFRGRCVGRRKGCFIKLLSETDLFGVRHRIFAIVTALAGWLGVPPLQDGLEPGGRGQPGSLRVGGLLSPQSGVPLAPGGGCGLADPRLAPGGEESARTAPWAPRWHCDHGIGAAFRELRHGVSVVETWLGQSTHLKRVLPMDQAKSNLGPQIRTGTHISTSARNSFPGCSKYVPESSDGSLLPP